MQNNHTKIKDLRATSFIGDFSGFLRDLKCWQLVSSASSSLISGYQALYTWFISDVMPITFALLSFSGECFVHDMWLNLRSFRELRQLFSPLFFWTVVRQSSGSSIFSITVAMPDEYLIIDPKGNSALCCLETQCSSRRNRSKHVRPIENKTQCLPRR